MSRALYFGTGLLCGEMMSDDAESLGRTGKAADPDATLTIGVTAGLPEPKGTSHRVPSNIGHYRIIRLLGEGGMGAVYEAEQDQPRRTVALKVIKAAWTSPELVHRFEREFQTLGRLHHPGIAQIYEAGTADTGFGSQPFFAMEIIHGMPLVEYAEKKLLDTRQRLALMIQVCEAVQHAHQRGIIHRDLKPGNILVDENSQPKILDFGLARVTDSDAQATRQTDMGQLLGTLAYMSPEQVLADPLALDTRSDVYALGVILYELLAGKLPYELTWQLPEVVRTIQQVDPVPLSTVNRAYRGDIETIVAKALEKDKTRRYGSAAEFADDIRRYLEDRPITAKPVSAGYQLRKFALRHKALVAGVTAVFAVLLVGVVVSTWQAVRARRAEMRAETATASAEAVNNFLQKDLLGQASVRNQSGPNAKPDPDLKVRTALDLAAAKIAGKFNKQPEVEAGIRDTIGQTYADLGLYPQAREQLERALDLERKFLGTEHPKTITTLNRLGTIEYLEGKFSEAEARLDQTLPLSRRVLGPTHPDTLNAMYSLGVVYALQAKYPAAESLLRQTLEIRRAVSGRENPETLRCVNALANIYSFEGKSAQAAELYEQTVEARRRVLGPEHPDTLISMNNLAGEYLNQNKNAQAEALFKQTLEISRRVLGAEHPDTLRCMNWLANAYRAEGEYAKAEALYGQTLELSRRVLGTAHHETLTVMDNLANAYGDRGKYRAAEMLYSQALEISRRVLGPEHPDTLNDMHNLALTYAVDGKYAQAGTLFKQNLELRRRILGPEDLDTLHTLASIASMYQRQGKYDVAETYAAQALAGLRHTLGPERPATMDVTADLALAYQSEGKFAASEPLAREALETDKKIQPDDWQRFRAESLLGASLAGEKKYAEAEPLLLEGYQGMADRKDRIGVADRYHLDRALEWIVRLYGTWGKPEKAAQWKRNLQSVATAR